MNKNAANIFLIIKTGSANSNKTPNITPIKPYKTTQTRVLKLINFLEIEKITEIAATKIKKNKFIA